LLSHLFLKILAHLLKRCVESWSQIQDVLENALPAGSDTGATLSNTLRKLLSGTRSAKTVQKTLAAIATLSPHSMQVERMVKHHNTIVQDRRSCMVEETVNARLLLAFNGESISKLDPR